MRIWPEQSRLSLNMRKNWKSTRPIIPYGEAQQEQEWQHGFGLGTGTAAEGWIDRAVKFWECNMKTTKKEFTGYEETDSWQTSCRR